MKGAAWAFGAILALVCGLSARLPAAEVEVTDRDRVFENFTREAATVGDGRIRIELRGFTLTNDHGAKLNIAGRPVKPLERRLTSDAARADVNRVQGGMIDLLGTYGLGANAEVGFDVPFLIQKTRVRITPTDGSDSSIETDNDQDVGDLLLYGKFKRKVAEHCVLAGGLELALPTGIEKKGFGTGELGFNPFLSTRYQRGRFAVGGHVGYQMYTGAPDDEFNYGAEVILRGNASYAIRTEIRGRYFKSFGDSYSDLVILPGFDFNLTDNFTIRPTGLAGLSKDALDWGIGIGLAFTL